LVSEQVESFLNDDNVNKAAEDQLMIEIKESTTADTSTGFNPGSFKTTTNFIKSLSGSSAE
jgi:hypothetical protein